MRQTAGLILIVLLMSVLAGCGAEDEENAFFYPAPATAEALAAPEAVDEEDLLATEPLGTACGPFVFTLYFDNYGFEWHATVERTACLGSNNALIVDGSTVTVDVMILESLAGSDVTVYDVGQWTWTWQVHEFNHLEGGLVDLLDSELAVTLTALDPATLQITWAGFEQTEMNSSHRICFYFRGAR